MNGYAYTDGELYINAVNAIGNVLFLAGLILGGGCLIVSRILLNTLQFKVKLWFEIIFWGIIILAAAAFARLFGIPDINFGSLMVVFLCTFLFVFHPKKPAMQFGQSICWEVQES